MHRSPLQPRRSVLLALAAAALQACGTTSAQPSTTAPPAPTPPAPPGQPSQPSGPARAASQIVGPTVADRGSPHYRFERFELDSVDGQRHYRVQLAVPKAPAPAAGYPLLVMLDGNAAMGALTDEMLAKMAASGRPVAIAALGYQIEQAIDSTARAFDYTPPVPGENPTWDSQARQRVGGGADVFLDLIEQRVLPDVRQRIPVDASRSTLWGHSYGGLLVMYTLFTRPALFARYAAADPSLWWHDGFILDVEARAQPLPTVRTMQVLLMAGGTQTAQDARSTPIAPAPAPAMAAAPTPVNAASAPGQGQTPLPLSGERRRAAMTHALPDMATRLAERPGLAVQWMPFPGVGHGPMRPQSIPPTLLLAAR